MNIKHIGLTIRDKDTNHISKEKYLSAKREGFLGWEERHYIAQVPKASLNYDLNMRYFASLDKEEFEKYLSNFCKKNHFEECFDLTMLDGVQGLYIMVLGEYKQIYIGKANDIKKRIQSHWNKKKSLERLIFGDVCSSRLSIDSFGSLDTTNVYFYKTTCPEKAEARIVNVADKKYLLNRTAGGIGYADTLTDSETLAKMAVVAGRKPRNFTSFTNLEELKSVLTKEDVRYLVHRYPELLQK